MSREGVCERVVGGEVGSKWEKHRGENVKIEGLEDLEREIEKNARTRVTPIVGLSFSSQPLFYNRLTANTYFFRPAVVL